MVEIATYHPFLLFGLPASTVKETVNCFGFVDTYVRVKPSRGQAG